jgi:hypothetical protein
MNIIKISFLALSRSIDLEIKSENAIDLIFNDFIVAFISSVDKENFEININVLQQNTAEFRKKIDFFVQLYKIIEPKFRRLNTYFEDLMKKQKIKLENRINQRESADFVVKAQKKLLLKK